MVRNLRRRGCRVARQSAAPADRRRTLPRVGGRSKRWPGERWPESPWAGCRPQGHRRPGRGPPVAVATRAAVAYIFVPAKPDGGVVAGPVGTTRLSIQDRLLKVVGPMQPLWNTLNCLLRSPPDARDDSDQEHSFREVITLQNVLVSQTVALLIYVQGSPDFSVRVELIFAVLSAMPLFGLTNIMVRRRSCSTGPVYVYSCPVRAYAHQVFVLWLLIVLGSAWGYWQGLLPGQQV